MKLQHVCILFAISFLVDSKKSVKIPEDVKKGEKLIQELLKGIELKDKHKIGDVFDEKFIYEGCKKKYNKDETITLVSAVDEQKAYMIERNTEIVTTGPYKFATSLSDQFDKLQSSFVVSKDWNSAFETFECSTLRAGWGALVGIKEVLRIMPNKERIILFKQNVLPALLYASETWTCNAGSTLRLKKTVTGLIDAAEIRGWNFNLERYLLAKQSRFAGHILRRDPNRWTKICTEWDPSHNKNWKRAVGGQKKRWAKDIDEEYAKFHHNSAMSGQVVVGRRRLGMLTPKAPWLSNARTDREKWKEFVRSCLAT
eukprot:NP_491432.2 Uncharacterized protein CELE_W09C3.8 [Caenorhabditis elegans]